MNSGGEYNVPQDSKGTREGECNDEGQDQGNSEMRILFKCPAVSDEGGDAKVHHYPDDLDSGFFEWEVPHVIASPNVDRETGVPCYSLVVVIHEIAG